MVFYIVPVALILPERTCGTDILGEACQKFPQILENKFSKQPKSMNAFNTSRVIIVSTYSSGSRGNGALAPLNRHYF